jgi:hypothetical protein
MLHTTPNDATARTTALIGHLTEADADGCRRLYRDPAVDLYIQVRAEDVVEQSPAVDGQSLIWVRPDASVVWHETMPVSSFATTTRTYKWPRP